MDDAQDATDYRTAPPAFYADLNAMLVEYAKNHDRAVVVDYLRAQQYS